jgi:alkanesulfonate monooxygenase SsuD/methylene tetrahydromethanopterin reductase-like flavin-dependent oxidoreductase (luciferase family)
MRERVEAVKAIWTRDEASYDGEQVRFERIWSWPKPAQHPHPPVMIGGNGPKVIDRVLSYGDAWMPQHRHGNAIGRIAELQRGAAEAGRGHVPVVVFGVPAKPEVLAEYERAGADRAVHWLPAAQRGPVEQALERFEGAVAELRGK